jgi:cytoskeletal protein CcmA (bactofilin family)
MATQDKTPKQTLVAEGTELKGSLHSSWPVVVHGTIDGRVDAPELTITRLGSVLGAVKAKTLRSHGTLSGNVDAGDVFLAGAVRSNTIIRATSLELKLGSLEKGSLEVIFGESNIGASDASTTSSNVGDSSASAASKTAVSAAEPPSNEGWSP